MNPKLIHVVFVLGFLGVWLFLVSNLNVTDLYQKNWPIALTMLLGSFIAGSTCAGGGAVAFPVMTLILGFSTVVARDFSLFIQSVGMISASIYIFTRRIPVDTKILSPSILIASTSAVLGVMISQVLNPSFVKIFYLSLGFSFSFIFLFVEFKLKNSNGSNSESDRLGSKKTHFVVCILGGFVSGIVGSGIDFFLFAYLILMKKQNIKISTPTSVIVMAAVSLVISILRISVLTEGLSQQTYYLWLTASPIVLFGAPFGVLFAKVIGSKVLTTLIVGALTMQYIFGLFTLPLNFTTGLLSLVTILLSIYCFKKLHKPPQPKTNNVTDLVQDSKEEQKRLLAG